MKYDKDGIKQWEKVWTGPGAGRDQATGIVLTNDDIYICGFSYTSGVNDYDMVTLKYKKDGSFVWASTFNGPGSSYDGAAAIALNASGLYVAGVINNTTSSSLDYGLIRYDMSSGTQIWNVSYDYIQLMDIPFALTVSNDSIITITGGSQSSLYDWDYATLNYGPTDTLLSTNRVSGTSAGFDRALAVKSDSNGNVYITGSSAQNSTGYDVKTVKILANGTLDWMKTQDGDGADDEGTDLIVDADENVYVCGTIGFNGQKDIMVLKYDKHGVQQWSQYIDYSTGDDFGVKMCFDQYGNIIVTGSVKTNVYDIYTAGFKPEDGAKVWEDVYDAPYHGLDKAFDITCDANGYIYVTGTAEADTGFGTVTLKYRTDYYTEPGQVDTPAVSYLFYPNTGQIIDTDGKTNNGVDYYTQHHYPQLYFREGEMNMVWAHIDQDTATADTMQRVDVSFLGSSNPTKAFPLKERDDAGYLNYFLGHCPNGITQVYGNESLLFEGVYSGIDAIYSSNNAGLKLYFVCAAQSDPSNIGLKFEGQDTLKIINNWGLQVQTLLGTYEFEKPKVYQLDDFGNRIALPWLLSWTMNAGDEAKFTGWGNYDRDKTLVIEIGKSWLPQSFYPAPAWSTYIGGVNNDEVTSVCSDNSNDDVYITGFTSSDPFINQPGQLITFIQYQGMIDAIAAKFSSNGVLIWKTFYGGSANDWGNDIVLDHNNSLDLIYFVGHTTSQATFRQISTSSTNCFQQQIIGGHEAFVVELDAISGLPLWSTSFGGGETYATACAIDKYHNIVIVGDDQPYNPSNVVTNCLPKPIGPGAMPTLSLCDPGGGAYFQYFAGNNSAPVVPYNYDGFILRFNNLGEMNYGTYFGGDENDYFSDVTVDYDNEIIITGSTKSRRYSTCTTYCSPTLGFCEGELPLCNHSQNPGTYLNNRLNVQGGFPTNTDAIIVKLNKYLNLEWATYFGSSAYDWGSGITTNSANDIYISGYTNSFAKGLPDCEIPSMNLGFPSCHPGSSYSQSASGGSTSQATENFIARFSSAGELKWSTFLGGYGSEGGSPKLCSDSRDNIYMVGSTNSPETSGTNSFPVNPSNFEYFQDQNCDVTYNQTYNVTDGFIACFSNQNTPLWMTYFGGQNIDICNNVTASGLNKLYVVGTTQASTSFPINIPNPSIQCCSPTLTGQKDGFLSEFDISSLITIEEIQLELLDIKIFPNPAVDFFSIDFDSKMNDEFVITLQDAFGRLLQKQRFNPRNGSNHVTLNLYDLPAGVYFLSLQNNNSIVSKKVIKND